MINQYRSNWQSGIIQRNHRANIWKWNESGFRPPLCTYRLNWARRTSWGWWDEWDDTVLQTQDSKFEPWRSEAEHATSWSQRLPTILTFTRGWGRNIFVSLKPPRPGTEPRKQNIWGWNNVYLMLGQRLRRFLGQHNSQYWANVFCLLGTKLSIFFSWLCQSTIIGKTRSNWKNALVSMVYAKVFQRFKGWRVLITRMLTMPD